MKYFDFSSLITKYSSDFVAITLSSGYYDDFGDWVKGDTVLTPLTGAIINQTENKIFRSEGALTEKDKQLFMLEPIDNKLHGATVVHEGIAYSLSDCLENAKFTGVYAYTLKYISAFKDIAPDYDLSEDLKEFEQRLDGVLEEKEEPQPPESISDAELLKKRLEGSTS